MWDPTTDVTSAELWRFFAEVAASGEVRPLPKAEFLRRLPAVMARLFGSLKSHNIVRAGHRVRGFRGVDIRLDGYELESESEEEPKLSAAKSQTMPGTYRLSADRGVAIRSRTWPLIARPPIAIRPSLQYPHMRV